MNNFPANKYIAVMITCYNRKAKTLSCLKRLNTQRLPEKYHCEVFLVDDGSSDGTGDAVNEQFPDVILVRGTGGLYWNKGMRLAWKTALEKRNYDYYLLLNDDTDLNGDAIKRLVETETALKASQGMTGIMVGSTTDPVDGHHTYGGVTRVKNYIGLRFSLVAPSNEPRVCDTFNANCVLISRKIVDDVGILSDKFSHGMGDTDYGLRAKEKGYNCWVVPGFIGSCANNESTNTWFDGNLTLKERKQLLYSPKGQPPDEWLYFVKRHAGMLWILTWIQTNMRLYFPQFWKLLRRLRGRND